MKKEYFVDYPPFINRKKERDFLLDYFHNAPKNILFLYGPKSTGKTTLIKKVINELDKNKYDASFFNMREHFIIDFKSFRTMFFPPNLKEKTKKMLNNSTISVPGFSWSPDDEAMIQTDIFATMLKKMEELKENNIQPIIIIDEFQYLRNISIYDKELQKEVLLIEELFKFFIALTKQNNLAHVVCLTSDSYYMAELYNDAKLVNTSDFQKIDHLSKEDIYYWLGERDKKNPCPIEMIDDIWNNLGGSVWEIWQVFVAYKNTGDWKEKLNDLLQVKYSYLADYYDEVVSDEWREKFLEISRGIIKNDEYVISRGEKVLVLVKDLVSRDYWFYDTKTKIITANGKSLQIGMERLIKEIDEQNAHKK